ncbi:MAG: class 1 fructose-bisphosphatase [Patescibacteria group bacterium]
MQSLTNFTQHLLTQHGATQQSRDLALLVNRIELVCKIISREVNKAGIVDILGSTGKLNATGDTVQRLDIYANELFIQVLRQVPLVRAIGSEENEEIVDIEENAATGSYVVLFDPIDGSSNIDVNVSTGTIFTIFRTASRDGKLRKADYLQSGNDVIAAGYVLYGSSTMLVYSSGYGVHGFTLDPSIGEFLLSHEHLRFKKWGGIYSINESYEPLWDKKLRSYVKEIKTKTDITGKPKSARYIGSLVSDFHRNLLKGGIFLYPADKKNPDGKLRLLFEGVPLAYLTHQAGGMASDGKSAILNQKPKQLHQRTPLFIGSAKDVERVEELLKL